MIRYVIHCNFVEFSLVSVSFQMAGLHSSFTRKENFVDAETLFLTDHTKDS